MIRSAVRYSIILIAFFLQKGLGALARVRSWASFQEIGSGSRCALSVTIKFPKNIRIGHHVAIGPDCTLGAMAPIVLEDFVRISKGVTIETAGLDLSKSVPYPHIASPILIKRGAWIGARSMVLGGVTVGENAVIGAGVVVARDVADGEIVVSARSRTIARIDEWKPNHE